MLISEIINEVGGVGKIVKGINTTPDVGPGEIRKQAAKFGIDVTNDGVPAIANTNGKGNFAKRKKK